ncbi:hypothetical protein V7S43_010393 [Phytophthora oleae]|uniref:HECT domain-containing protein n=1 Tax=Phytophthora oleae TaxID=2107226 RepID=A0ABD3FGI3_9STRA
MNTELSTAPRTTALYDPNPSDPKDKSKAKKKKISTTVKKSRGWGRFHSVLKERSVDFNLTLDVQNLQQQVRDLTTLRDLLSTRTFLRRHSTEGSLFHVVKEYLRVFRTGWSLQETGRKRLIDDQDQRAFLHSVMDPELDVGNGLRGPDVMAEQIILYSTFIRFIQVTLKSYDIVVAEDSVVIKTRAKLRFQVLRRTIEMVFPHIIGDECLVAQLVGQEVEPSIGITFSFNAEGKCCKYEFEVDFIEAFASLVKNPRKLDILLGKALIADNCMLGLIDEPLEMPSPNYRAGTLDEELYRLVDDYHFIFTNGYEQGAQRDFITRIFDFQSEEDVLRRWINLSDCFDVLEFRQTSVTSVEYFDQDQCTIRSTGSYSLRITQHTIEAVFRHLLPYPTLVDKLVGKILMVPSHLKFNIEMATVRIIGIVERMDFVKPIATLFQTEKDLSFVMSQALLNPDGSCCNPQPGLPSKKRTMNIANILT